MQQDERAGARAVVLGHRLDLGRVEHERVHRELLELAGRRDDEHRLGEERVVRARGDDSDADAVVRVGAGKVVDDVQDILIGEVSDDLRPQAVEMRLAEGVVDLAPPDPVPGSGSSTTNLSCGDLPVKRPVSTTRAPPCASRPAPLASAWV